MSCRILVVLTLAGLPFLTVREAVAQARGAQRARSTIPAAAEIAGRAPAPLDNAAKLQFLREITARPVPRGQQRALSTIVSWTSLAASAPGVFEPDARITPRDPHSDSPLEATLFASDVTWFSAGETAFPEGYIGIPRVLRVFFKPGAVSYPGLYLVDYALNVQEEIAVFRMSSIGCLINFENETEVDLHPSESPHLLAVVQVAEGDRCELSLEANTGALWTFYSWEATELE